MGMSRSGSVSRCGKGFTGMAQPLRFGLVGRLVSPLPEQDEDPRDVLRSRSGVDAKDGGSGEVSEQGGAGEGGGG